MMKVVPLPVSRLTPDLVRAWADFQQLDPTLESPFFRPEFAQAVASAGDSAEVAVLEADGAPVGFFPFGRDDSRRGLGGPVGWDLCDYHGLVTRPGLAVDVAQVVRACGLSAWDFDQVPAVQTAFGPHVRSAARSPYLDLSAGFDAYVTGRNESGTDAVRRTQRKTRMLAREVGPLRFEYQTTDPDVFRALLRWKQAQFARTGVPDLFALGWPVEVLERVLAAPGEEFAGVLSALHAGDKLVAIALCLRSRAVLHGWLTAYDPEFGRYSPGMVQTLELARAAADRGIRRLDLGRGEEEYKLRLMSGAVPLVEGSVAATGLTRILRGGWHRACEWVRESPLAGPARVARAAARRFRGWLGR
jgi:CelD/BcsL family acetyltransferase involved in cellulose biosynthesis